MVLTSEKNIIATSSAELFSAVLYRTLACSGVLWRAALYVLPLERACELIQNSNK
jgi:hypothetical protein